MNARGNDNETVDKFVTPHRRADGESRVGGIWRNGRFGRDHDQCAEIEQALDDLTEETNRLRTLVENLLRLARGDKQNNNLFEEVNLSLLLKDVSDSLRPLAKGLSLDCETSANLMVLGDSDELIRLFVNLLDNAVKYTERGGITISAKQDEKNILVEVSDTGIGIPAAHIPHIFDRFYLVEESRTLRGAGLGLAIVKEIVKAHGGEIIHTPAPR